MALEREVFFVKQFRCRGVDREGKDVLSKEDAVPAFYIVYNTGEREVDCPKTNTKWCKASGKSDVNCPYFKS